MNIGIVLLIFSFGYLLYVGEGVKGDCNGLDLTLTNKEKRIEYIEVTSTLPQLEHFTICTKVTTDERGMISGTVGSYSTKGQVDVLLTEGEMSAKGPRIKIGVNGQIKVIMSPLAKNKEYHFCVDYNLPKNKVSTFINGNLASVLTYDNVGSVPGGGKVIIGQRQGCYGGCFDKSRAFNGRMRNFVITTRPVTEAERKQIVTDNLCPKDVALLLKPQNTIPHITQAACPSFEYTLKNQDGNMEYLEVTKTLPDLNYLSACSWVKANDKAEIIGAIASYATKDRANILAAIGEKSGKENILNIFVNSQKKSVKMNLKANLYYHFCFVYHLPENQVVVYFNGKQVDKLDYTKLGKIAGGGSVIMGQQQGCRSGCFDKDYSYNGKLRNFMIWKRALSEQEVTVLVNKDSCPLDNFISLAPEMTTLKGRQ